MPDQAMFHLSTGLNLDMYHHFIPFHGFRTNEFWCSSLLWVNTSWQLNPTQLLAHSPQWDGREKWKSRSEKTLGLR